MEKARDLTAILYQNNEGTIFLLDIPTSIAAAQSFSPTSFRHLLSSEPLMEPYSTPQCHTEAARQRVGNQTGDDKRHSIYADLITQALNDIQRLGSGQPWCSPRRLSTNVELNHSELSSNKKPQVLHENFLKELSAYEDDPFDFEKRKAPVITWTAFSSARDVERSPSTELWNHHLLRRCGNGRSRTPNVTLFASPSTFLRTKSTERNITSFSFHQSPHSFSAHASTHSSSVQLSGHLAQLTAHHAGST